MATSTLSAGVAVLGGLLTVLSLCVLPILPVLVGRALTSHLYGSIALDYQRKRGKNLLGAI